VRTLQKAWRELRTPEEVRALFDNVAARVLTRLYQRPQLEPVQLFRHYGFGSAYADHTLARVERLAERVAGDELWVAGLPHALPHPRRFYAGLAERLAEEPLETACCWVHGDLNLANLLLDGGGNVWMIDYFWTRVAHALMDVAKLENDIKFILLPLGDDEALRRAAAWDVLLAGQADLLAALPELPAALGADAALGKAHAAVSVLRGLGARLLAEAGVSGPRPAREYHAAQLRYAAHTLSFDECDERQKRLALASTCRLSEALRDE
jgi:aminoglycoside phosphotransferase (APT) family kinase protein